MRKDDEIEAELRSLPPPRLPAVRAARCWKGRGDTELLGESTLAS
jgi:hypothetical protein